MLFSSFPDSEEIFLKFFLFFFKVIFLNLTVILSILTAFLRLIASHEASINNSGNTFMTTIACNLNLTHVIVNLSVTFDSRVGSGILA